MSLKDQRPATEAYLEITNHLRSRFAKIVNGFYRLTVFAKKLHRSCLAELYIRLLETLINPDSITLQ